MKWLKIGIFLTILSIFVYLRITPILNQTVPYTYDQGRDFLKIQEIFRDKNITFIGPTTGIQGVYHGVWWYYFLVLPYLLFSGWPQGFYFFLFFANLLANIGFYLFLKKEYGFASGLFFLSVTSVSTFFIRTAFFASNNILSPLFVMLLIYSIYQMLKKDKKIYFFLLGISLGFIFETELAFGLFVIPSFFITYFLLKKLKNIYLIAAGIIAPMTPRIFFELKNNFSQAKAFFSYLSSGKNEHPIQFAGLVLERLATFWQAWKSIFYQESTIIAFFFLAMVLSLLIFKNKLTKEKKISASFLTLFLFFIFIITLLNRNGFFWSYYIDGIQYIFLFLIMTGFYLLEKNRKTKSLSYFLLISAIFISLFVFVKEISGRKPIPLIGLRADDTIIRYVLEKNEKKNFCLNIYTPPIFPFTYRYLLDYYTKKDSSVYLTSQPVDNRCWYIIDYDDDKERINDWRKKNVPSSGKLMEKKTFENKTSVELILHPNLP